MPAAMDRRKALVDPLPIQSPGTTPPVHIEEYTIASPKGRVVAAKQP
jgi:hypothetical protein